MTTAEGFLKGRRLLIVEDEMLVLMLMEEMLGEMGALNIATAASADEALAQLEAEAFDAVTLDVNLNGGNSYSVADTLVERGIPFLFASGYSDHLRPGYEHWPLLKKPFRLEDLEALLRTLLPAASFKPRH